MTSASFCTFSPCCFHLQMIPAPKRWFLGKLGSLAIHHLSLLKRQTDKEMKNLPERIIPGPFLKSHLYIQKKNLHCHNCAGKWMEKNIVCKTVMTPRPRFSIKLLFRYTWEHPVQSGGWTNCKVLGGGGCAAVSGVVRSWGLWLLGGGDAVPFSLSVHLDWNQHSWFDFIGSTMIGQ